MAYAVLGAAGVIVAVNTLAILGHALDLAWLQDVAVNTGPLAVAGGAAAGGAAAGVGPPSGPPLPPGKGGPPAQTVSRQPEFQHPPVPPPVWTKAWDWINDELTGERDLPKVSIGRHLETEAAASEEEVKKPPSEMKTNI